MTHTKLFSGGAQHRGFHPRLKIALPAILLTLLAGCAGPALAPDRLRCEYRDNPLAIDSTSPRLSWILTSTRAADRQTAFQILVATDPQKLAPGEVDLWDSGKIVSDNSIQIPYAGKPVVSRQQCFWKVRVWDMNGKPSPWSAAQSWTMGFLKPDDWQAQWIGRGDEPTGLDLQNAHWIWPIEPSSNAATQPGRVAVFRKRFEVPLVQPERLWLVLASKASATAFLDGQQIAVVDDPRHAPRLRSCSAGSRRSRDLDPHRRKRHSRRHRRRDLPEHQRRAREIFPTDDSWDATFEPNDLQGAWAPARRLANYTNKSWGAPPVQGPSLPLLRKQFTITTPPKRAVIYLCGLGQFQLHINGQVVGDEVLQPGWTDYRNTCLYAAYDVTSFLKPGPNAIGVMLGNGMYNVTPGRYSKFLGSMGSPQLIAQLFLENPDGSTQRIATDDTWKVSPGPVTFSSIYGGEDYDGRLDKPGWDTPSFDDSTWTSAISMSGPGGQLAASDLPPRRSKSCRFSNP